ncbi:MAG: YegS/Rv2252/BmrU family lipid kinase [Bacteroidetes bacterium]|nr:YegS/Rv2252/BmrU family lipid kinase [Bacteroidota bacterium]
MPKRNILYVVNPKAGVKKKNLFRDIEAISKQKGLNYRMLVWERADQDIVSLVKENLDDSIDIVVAIGGDGMVNRIAQALVNTKFSMGIIPMGSGNGLARFLQIPLSLEKSIDVLLNGKIVQVDTCEINNQLFMATAGAGFDAHVGKLFANSTKRGFFSYVKITLKQFKVYEPKEYELVLDGKSLKIVAFSLTIANANQWGNNAVIAPEADIQDGIMEITVLKPFKMWNAPNIALRLFNKTIHLTKHSETFKAREILITRSDGGAVHYDGEPDEMGTELRIKINPLTINMVVPDRSNFKSIVSE